MIYQYSGVTCGTPVLVRRKCNAWHALHLSSSMVAAADTHMRVCLRVDVFAAGTLPCHVQIMTVMAAMHRTYRSHAYIHGSHACR